MLSPHAWRTARASVARELALIERLEQARHADAGWRAAQPPCPALPDTPVIGEVETFLREAVGALAPSQLDPVPKAGGRPRILPGLCLWSGLLVCVLRGFSSQLALWRLLSSQGVWHFPRVAIGDQALYKRLAAGGTAPLETLFSQVRTLLAARLAPFLAQQPELAPFATQVLVLDESTLDQLRRTLPTLRAVPSGDDRLIPGKLAGLFDVRTQLWTHVERIAAPRQNEKVAAWGLLDRVPTGSLLLFDLGYFAFAWLDALTTRQLHWVTRCRAKTSYTVLHTYYEDRATETLDALVWLGAYRADRAQHAVRLVQFRVGQTLVRYLTNVLDPARLSLHAIAQLYARRWDFELAIKLVKRELKLHLLWSAKDVVIEQQLWAVLLIAQVLHALRVEIAARAGVGLFDVSLPLLVQYLPQFAAQGRDPVTAFVEQGRDLGFIRPARRVVIQAPDIPLAQLSPVPPHLALERTPRYAHRKGTPRPALCPMHDDSS